MLLNFIYFGKITRTVLAQFRPYQNVFSENILLYTCSTESNNINYREYNVYAFKICCYRSIFLNNNSCILKENDRGKFTMLYTHNRHIRTFTDITKLLYIFRTSKIRIMVNFYSYNKL